MARIAAHVVLAAPPELCFAAVQGTLADARLAEAYRRLRSGKEYGGWVTASTPGRRLEIAFAALEPGSGRRTHRLGWRVTYDFVPLPEGGTRAEVGVEYGLLAAIGGAGLLRAQAENDVAHRLMAMLTLELGVHRGTPRELPAGDAAPDPHAYRPATRAL